MRKDELDPFAYIENAFLDVEKAKTREKTARDAPQPVEPTRTLVSAIRGSKAPEEVKLRRTEMRAPRPRKRKSLPKTQPVTSQTEQLWTQLPKNLKFLAGVYDDNVTQNYYTTKFKESREELIRRLVDPELNLEDTARLLGVCPATVRRYTNRGWLPHHRTNGNQRRFRLSGIVAFVEKHGRNPE